MSTVTDTMKNLGTAKLAAMGVAAAVIMGFFVILALRVSTAGLIPLYTNLSLEDSSKIVAELEQQGIPYELVANGTQIMVPSDRALRLRMGMAEQGLPSGGSVVGYEIFDRSESMGTSTFVMNVNMLRALEGELARTIGSVDGVDSARVHLVMPKREVFAREKEVPSASVTVKMRGGQALEKNEVMAITHLIASAVPGLQTNRVTVVDSHGRLLARGDGGDSADAAASTAQEFRIAYETRMQQTLEDLLEKVIGAGKVRVTVAADINFDRVVTNSEKFDPEGQVARSVQSNSEKDDSKDKSGKEAVSVANNLPQGLPSSDTGPSSNRLVERAGETTNFEISKTVQNHVREGGTVNKLSVAVLVDGTYQGADGSEQTYTPRTEAELTQLRSLINSAIGFDEKRGDKVEVVNMRFTTESLMTDSDSFFERFKIEMQSVLQTLIIAGVAILAIMLVLRPAVMQLVRNSQSPSERVSGELVALDAPSGMGGGMQARLPASMPGGGAVPAGGGGISTAAEAAEQESLIDVANIKGGMKSSSMRKVIEIVDKYPEETMGVLRQWIMKPQS